MGRARQGNHDRATREGVMADTFVVRDAAWSGSARAIAGPIWSGIVRCGGPGLVRHIPWGLRPLATEGRWSGLDRGWG